ncbi:MAG: phosphohistidine phosphatase SixA [Thermoanaerobaculia bacterium]
MLIWLMRHGDAEIRGQDDHRELTPEGRDAIEKLARRVAERTGAIHSVHHSGKRRAEQTAEILASTMKLDLAPAPLELLRPNADPYALARWIESLAEPVALVTHLPLVERVAGVLISGSPEVPVLAFSTGTIAAIEKERDQWKLAWSERA